MEKLTVKEALEQGYEYFVYPADGYQTISKLGIDEPDFNRRIMLCKKEPFHPSAPDNEELKDLLAEHVWDNHHGNTGDDTDAVYDAVKEIDFSDVSGRIQSKLNELNYYRQSEVELVKEVK